MNQVEKCISLSPQSSGGRGKQGEGAPDPHPFANSDTGVSWGASTYLDARWDHKASGSLGGVRFVAARCERQPVIEKWPLSLVFPPPAKTCGGREPDEGF